MVFANELDHWRLLLNNNNSKALRASSLQETAFYVALSDNGLATACNVSVSGDNASEGGNSPSALPATAAEATVAGTSESIEESSQERNLTWEELNEERAAVLSELSNVWDRVIVVMT